MERVCIQRGHAMQGTTLEEAHVAQLTLQWEEPPDLPRRVLRQVVP